MIRLLRRKRKEADAPRDVSSLVEMIEPVAPAREAPVLEASVAAGDAKSPSFFEPSLKIPSVEDLDESELAEIRDGAPNLDFRLSNGTPSSAMDAGDDAGKTIHLEVHNTAIDRGGYGKGRGADKSGSDRQAHEDVIGQARNAEAKAEEVKPRGGMLHTVPFRETRLADIDREAAANPAFNIFANARMWRHDERNLNYSGEVAKLYRDVFTPTRPKQSYRDFTGRRDTIEAIIQAIEEERSHVILLGEKSLGKTSLLNIVAECAREAGYLVARITGTADLTFEHFIFAILEQFSARIDETPVKDILQKRLGTDDLCQLVDREKELDVPAAIKIFQRLTEHQAIVLIDDCERIGNPDLKMRIGELMSVLSDQGAWLSLLLSGRATRAGEILPESFESLPNVTWIKLQPMSDEDAARVIARGVSAVGVQFGGDVTETIVRLSQGIPSAIQWLCLLAIRRATQRYASEVELHDLAEVVSVAASKIDARLCAFYDEICGPTRGSWADEILYLAVRTPTDRCGAFSTEAMSGIALDAIGRSVLELPLHSALTRLADDEGQPILEKVWTAQGTCYRFVNPVMRAIVMLKNCGRMPHMPSALLGAAETVELLPSRNAAPEVA